MREVRLTVSWQSGAQVDQFTVVTHIASMGRGTDQVNSDPVAQAALSATTPGGGIDVNSMNSIFNAAGLRPPMLPPGANLPGMTPGTGAPGAGLPVVPRLPNMMPNIPRLPPLGGRR